MVPRVHQPVCDVYPKYDPSKPLEEQDATHNFLILDPRGEFKTSISMGKTLQNYINFPEACTLRMSGKEETVEAMLKEGKDQLISNTTLRDLYPEHVPYSNKKGEEGEPPTKFGYVGSFTNPYRKRPRREPTVAVSTLDSVKASTHYEWITGDDLVHEKNYQTRELLEKTITDWNLARNLLNPRGFRELVGTRYDWSDLYGNILEKNKGEWRTHVRPIWTDDLDYAKANGFFIPENYQSGDLIHLHPERWSLKELAEIQSDDPYLFNCQRLNNPMPTTGDNFPMVELIKHTVTRDKYPDTGSMNLFLVWWFNMTDLEEEPACGVVGGWDSRGRLFIVDLVMGRFKPSRLIELTIGFWQKWPLMKVAFEDSKRQRPIEAGLVMELRRHRMMMSIDWVKYQNGMGQTDEDLISKVLAIEPLLRADKFYLHSELPNLTSVYLQFSRFPKFKLRAIPAAISRLMHYRIHANTGMDMAIYGSELYSPSLSWDTQDPELGAGIVG